MATLKEQLGRFTELAGTEDADEAFGTISGWRDRAGNSPDLAAFNEMQFNLNEIFSSFGVTDHGAAIDAINLQRANIGAIYAELGVHDQEAAIAAIRSWRDQSTAFQVRIAELEGSQADFDARLNQEVINRAASAGIMAPVPKDQKITTEGVNPKVMVRSEFERLNAGAQMQFIRGGGRLTDDES